MTCDILEDPKLEKLTGGEFRLFINLLATLARAGSRDGEILLGPGALRRLACKQQTRHAEPLWSRLADVGLTSARRVADAYLTTVPKWAELQGFSCTKRVEESREEKREPIRGDPPPPATAPPDLESIPTDQLADELTSRVGPLVTPPGTYVIPLDDEDDVAEKEGGFSSTPPPGESVQSVQSVHTSAVQIAGPLATRKDAEKLAQLLSKKPGTQEEKVEWVYQNIDQIVADCEIAATEKGRDPIHADLRGHIYRYYHQHCKNLKREKDGHRPWGEKDAQSIKRDLGIADG